jgi:hypothetical protein
MTTPAERRIDTLDRGDPGRPMSRVNSGLMGTDDRGGQSAEPLRKSTAIRVHAAES